MDLLYLYGRTSMDFLETFLLDFGKCWKFWTFFDFLPSIQPTVATGHVACS
jgi:hypothetical protein